MEVSKVDRETLIRFLQEWKKGKSPSEIKMVRKALSTKYKLCGFAMTEEEKELVRVIAQILYDAQIIPSCTISEVMRYAFYSLLHTLSKKGILQAALRAASAAESAEKGDQQEYEEQQTEQPSDRTHDESQELMRRHEGLHDVSSQTHERNNPSAYSRRRNEQYQHNRTPSSLKGHAPQSS